MNYIIKISDFLSNLADLFYGDYNYNNSGINEMRNEIFDIYNTPNTCDDKDVLKEDLNIFLKDTQKAHKSIKEELSYGKAE